MQMPTASLDVSSAKYQLPPTSENFGHSVDFAPTMQRTDHAFADIEKPSAVMVIG
jgi:hypothetical protein